MPQYLLSVWHDADYELDFSTDDAQRQVAQVGAFNDALQAAGAWVFAGGLHPASEARVIRPGDAGETVIDGGFAAGGPQLGGFWIIDADDEAALAWAQRAAAACEGPVELRPMQG